MTAETALGILLAHAVGDYVIQSDWMAQEKTRRWWPAILHGLTYTLPYALLTQSLTALAVIASTHMMIDRFRLARYVCWAKNWLAPRGWQRPWSECTATGYPSDRPLWLTTWLLIIVDNTIHVTINTAAILWLGGAS